MDYTQRAYEHIRYLSEIIGGRGSCTADECRAAEYAREQLRKIGVAYVKFEPFYGAPSTYRPFILAFASALLGTIPALTVGNRVALAAGG